MYTHTHPLPYVQYSIYFVEIINKIVFPLCEKLLLAKYKKFDHAINFFFHLLT